MLTDVLFGKFKKIFFTLTILILLTFGVYANNVSVSAEAAILTEAESGDVIFKKNAHTRLPMASTTKIMTAVVALEYGDLDKTVVIPKEACGIEGSSIYLREGETMTLCDLLYGLMLESANDAATAIAYEISGSVEEFALLMNQKADEIGLCDTHFTNPHGLDNEAHYTTAADLAKLTAYAMKNDTFCKIVASYKHSIPENRVLLNHNKLLRLSEDSIGVKTGFTKRSGRCLVSAAERDGVRVIAVTLNAPDDWNDHLTLYELGFSSYSCRTVAEKGQFQIELPCVGAENGTITAANTDECKLCIKNGDEVTYTLEADRILFPNVHQGDKVGEIVFRINGATVATLPLVSMQSVTEAEEKTFKERILDLIS